VRRKGVRGICVESERVFYCAPVMRPAVGRAGGMCLFQGSGRGNVEQRDKGVRGKVRRAKEAGVERTSGKLIGKQRRAARFWLTPINSKKLSFFGIDAYLESLVFTENMGACVGLTVLVNNRLPFLGSAGW
jgi:hypothetical protein